MKPMTGLGEWSLVVDWRTGVVLSLTAPIRCRPDGDRSSVPQVSPDNAQARRPLQTNDQPTSQAEVLSRFQPETAGDARWSLGRCSSIYSSFRHQ